MARMTRMTLEQIKASKPTVDRAKLDATTEEDIRRHMIEDGQDPDEEPTGYVLVEPPQVIRKRLGMTQEEFAAALTVPLATLRNWEQGRFALDPAAKALLRIVAANPKAALKALRR
jgi:putative transcriptional regulator